jgi:KDO2-lipid IV(A) lauroyltransferase
VGKRPSEHHSRVTRIRRRIRNARRRLYGWVVSAFTWTLLRVPYGLHKVLYYWWLRLALKLVVGRTARRNLRQAFGDRLGEQETERILSAMCSSFARMPLEAARFYWEGTRYLDEHIDDDDARAVMRDLEERWPGGWIAVTGHVGNWEIGGQWLKHASSREMGGIVAKRQPNPHLNRIVERFRGRHGMATLYRDDPIGPVLRLLRNGGCIGVAGDQDVESLPGAFVEFLGRPAYTPLGPARLAWSANVPILVGVLLRTGVDRFRLQLNPPMFPDRSRPKHEEVLRLTREWSRQMEEIIRAHPEQWPWFHNRWKTTPERLEAKKRRRIANGDTGAEAAEAEELLDRGEARARRRREQRA